MTAYTKKGAPQEIRRIQRLLKDPLAALTINQITSSRLATFRDKRLNDGTRAAAIDLVLISHCLKTAVSDWELSLATNPANKVTRPAPSQ